jgi:hypothetical protein
MKNILVFTMLLLVWACSRTPKGNTSRQENSYGNDAPLSFESKVLDNDSTLRVFINLEWKRLYEEQPVQKFINDYTLSYIVTPDYNSKEVIASKTMTLNDQVLERPGQTRIDVY